MHKYPHTKKRKPPIIRIKISSKSIRDTDAANQNQSINKILHIYESFSTTNKVGSGLSLNIIFIFISG